MSEPTEGPRVTWDEIVVPHFDEELGRLISVLTRRTILTHHENGCVGPLEGCHLDALEMTIRWAVNEMDVSYLADLMGLRDALSEILGEKK